MYQYTLVHGTGDSKVFIQRLLSTLADNRALGYFVTDSRFVSDVDLVDRLGATTKVQFVSDADMCSRITSNHLPLVLLQTTAKRQYSVHSLVTGVGIRNSLRCPAHLNAISTTTLKKENKTMTKANYSNYIVLL